MDLVARLEDQHPDLVEYFAELGVKARLGLRATYVWLELWENVGDHMVYHIAPELREATIYLCAQESGGKGAGKATIVCGSKKGEALEPFFIDALPESNGVQACFNTKVGLVTISASGEAKLKIKHHKVRVDDDRAMLFTRKLWKGKIDNVPAKWQHFEKACRAALEKLACKDCRCVHYHGKRSRRGKGKAK